MVQRFQLLASSANGLLFPVAFPKPFFVFGLRVLSDHYMAVFLAGRLLHVKPPRPIPRSHARDLDVSSFPLKEDVRKSLLFFSVSFLTSFRPARMPAACPVRVHTYQLTLIRLPHMNPCLVTKHLSSLECALAFRVSIAG